MPKIDQSKNTAKTEIDCARKLPERRSAYFRSLLYSMLGGRRRHNRRTEDLHDNTVIDFHEPKLAVLSILLIFLCVTDAALTLYIISIGGQEVNPFMKYLMDADIMLFFWVKFLLTTFGLVFLILHKRFIFYRLFSGYHVIYAVVAMYFILVNYEILLITQGYSGV